MGATSHATVARRIAYPHFYYAACSARTAMQLNRQSARRPSTQAETMLLLRRASRHALAQRRALSAAPITSAEPSVKPGAARSLERPLREAARLVARGLRERRDGPEPPQRHRQAKAEGRHRNDQRSPEHPLRL